MILKGGTIPIGFDFHQTHQLNAKRSKAVYDKELSRAVLERCMKAIDSLIKGNSRKGFNFSDSIILLNSIHNKCIEILNESVLNIDNNILLEQTKLFKTLYYNQYIQDATRFKLENSGNAIAYNTSEGIVLFNPNCLYDIVVKWCHNNQVHPKYDDIPINS